MGSVRSTFVALVCAALMTGCGSSPREVEPAAPLLWAAGCGPSPGCSCDAGGLCDGGAVARSDDLGRTWTQTFFEGGITSVAFSTREKGWAVGNQGTVFRTLDGGSTWTLQVTGIDPPTERIPRDLIGFDSVRFLDERRGVMAGVGQTDQIIGVFGPGIIYGSEIVILITEDGGESWAPATIDRPSVPVTSGDPEFDQGGTGVVHSLCFTKSGIGLLAGEPSLLSRDGGRTWHDISEKLPYTRWVQAECGAEERLWLGTVDFVRSDDGGETWSHLSPGGLGFTCCGGAADFVTETIGWSFTEHLLRTVDGGTTWGSIDTPPRPGAFTILEFASPEVGVWAGDRGGYVTHDAGESWELTTIVPLELDFRIADIVVVE